MNTAIQTNFICNSRQMILLTLKDSTFLSLPRSPLVSKHDHAPCVASRSHSSHVSAIGYCFFCASGLVAKSVE